MCNCDCDLTHDFQINDTKIVEIPKQSTVKEEQIQNRTKRAMSNIDAKKNQNIQKPGTMPNEISKTKGKNSK